MDNLPQNEDNSKQNPVQKILGKLLSPFENSSSLLGLAELFINKGSKGVKEAWNTRKVTYIKDDPLDAVLGQYKKPQEQSQGDPLDKWLGDGRMGANVVQSSQPKKLEGTWQGTNYDPLDVWQNRPDATEENKGIGASQVRIDDTMVAVSRKPNSDEAMLRLGTVLRDPNTGKKYLVADLMSHRFDGQKKIDFATPQTGKKIKEEYNKPFEGLEIIREGNGYEDVRVFVESGEWAKMLKS